MGKIIDFYSIQVKKQSEDNNIKLTQQEFVKETSERLKNSVENFTDKDTAKLIFQYTLALYTKDNEHT